MIHVIATIAVRPGGRGQFLREFEALRRTVIAEDGCIEYGAAIAVDTGLTSGGDYVWSPARDDAVIIVEKWSSMDTWKAHLTAPHMDAYRSRTRDLVTGRSVQVLTSIDKEVPTPVL